LNDPVACLAGPCSRLWFGQGPVACVVLALVFGTRWASGDQVEMQNGDRYAGKVLSVSTNTIVLQSDVLGTITLPRARVASVKLGAAMSVTGPQPASIPPVRALALPSTNTPPEEPAALRRLGENTNLIQQVQKQFLNEAGPEAKAKFDELLGGLMSGKLDITDIRTQAKSAADQLRALKREQGDDPGGTLDGYLSILEKFLKDTTPPAAATGTVTNPPP